MAAKKDGTTYRALREFALPDGTVIDKDATVTLTDDDAALLVRDGMVAPAEGK